MDVATVFGNSSFVTYSNEAGYVAVVGVSTAIAFSLIGTIANLFVLAKAATSTHAPSTTLLLSVIAADFSVCLCVLIFNSVNLTRGGVERLGCLIQGVICVYSVFVSVASLSAVAVERYLCAVRGVYLSNRGVNTWILLIWIILAFVLAILPFLYGTSYDEVYNLESSFGTCFVAWSSSNPRVIIIIWFLIALVAASMIAISICYYLVYRSFKTVFGSSAGVEKAMTVKEKERKVMIKCVVLTIVFITFWIPYLWSVIYQAITRQATSALYNATAEHFVLFVSVLNPLLLMRFDNRLYFASQQVEVIRKSTIKQVNSWILKRKHSSTDDQKNHQVPMASSIKIDVVSAPPVLSELNFSNISELKSQDGQQEGI